METMMTPYGIIGWERGIMHTCRVMVAYIHEPRFPCRLMGVALAHSTHHTHYSTDWSAAISAQQVDIVTSLQESFHYTKKIQITIIWMAVKDWCSNVVDFPHDVDHSVAIALGDVSCNLCTEREPITWEVLSEVQWNLSNTDTLGPLKKFLIREVSSFQGAKKYIFILWSWDLVKCPD